MAIIVKLTGGAATKEKVASVARVFDQFALIGSNNDFGSILVELCNHLKVDADFLIRHACTILFLETGYCTSGQFKQCNQGGMEGGTANWVGKTTVTDSLIKTASIPQEFKKYFSLGETSTTLTIQQNWFKEDYYVDGRGTKYPKFKEPWMGLVTKILYFATVKPAGKVLQAYINKGDQWFNRLVSKGVLKSTDLTARNALIMTARYRGTLNDADLEAYFNLLSSIKKNNFSLIIT